MFYLIDFSQISRPSPTLKKTGNKVCEKLNERVNPLGFPEVVCRGHRHQQAWKAQHATGDFIVLSVQHFH